MKVYEPQNIRNIALLGHANSGKTLLAESILFESGSINRRGSLEEHNTVSDFNEIEHERNCSILSTTMFTEWKDCKINMLDAPGYDDYIGELCASARVADIIMIPMNAQNGIEVGTENAWENAQKYNSPVAFILNKLDVEQAKFQENVDDIKHVFSGSATVMQYPIHLGLGFNSYVDLLSMKLLEFPAGGGAAVEKEIPESEKATAEDLRNSLVENIAAINEDLMNKYFENGELSDEEFKNGLKSAIVSRQLFPIFCVSGKNGTGISRLLDVIVEFLPSPADMPPLKTVEGKELACNPNGPTVLFVYKLLSEAHLGDLTFFRVYSGKISAGVDLVNEQKNSGERFNQVFLINGKKRVEVPHLVAGDIGATVKLKITGINDTLHEKGKDFTVPPIQYPRPRVRTAIVPKTKGDEEKVGIGCNNLHNEDPSLVVEHSQELRQMILHAQGDLHLSASKWRLEH
ncbi:MAG: GTP-binding protein, partial [Bacteroidota bacterium]